MLYQFVLKWAPCLAIACRETSKQGDNSPYPRTCRLNLRSLRTVLCVAFRTVLTSRAAHFWLLCSSYVCFKSFGATFGWTESWWMPWLASRAVCVCVCVRACLYSSSFARGAQWGEMRGCLLPGTAKHGFGKRGPSTFWCVLLFIHVLPVCWLVLAPPFVWWFDGLKYDGQTLYPAAERHSSFSMCVFVLLCVMVFSFFVFVAINLPQFPHVCMFTHTHLSPFLQHQRPHDFLPGNSTDS